MKNKKASKKAIISTAVLCLTAFSLFAAAHDRNDGFRTLNPSSLPPAHGYSHIVIAPVGKLVTISGQVAMDNKGHVVGENDFAAQCDQVFKNIHRALQAVDLTFRDVTRTDMFVTSMNHLPDLRECRKHYLPGENLPAANLVEVKSLFRPDLMLEISVQAVIPQHARSH